jgi:hypothetical protein
LVKGPHTILKIKLALAWRGLGLGLVQRPQGSALAVGIIAAKQLISKAGSNYLEDFCFAEWLMQMWGRPNGSEHEVGPCFPATPEGSCAPPHSILVSTD